MRSHEQWYSIAISFFACSAFIASVTSFVPAASGQDSRITQVSLPPLTSTPAAQPVQASSTLHEGVSQRSTGPISRSKKNGASASAQKAEAEAVPEKESFFAKALASCDADVAETDFTLPGLKAEIKLDRCYRGREHLDCRIQKIASEEQALLKDFTHIVDLKYPELNSVNAVCKIARDSLVGDFSGTTEFLKRYKAFESEYDLRLACANKVTQSIKEVSLPDLVQAPEMLKSIMDVMDQEIARVTQVHEQVTTLWSNIEASRKAIGLLQKIHRAMCPQESKSASAKSP
jgi:hypothetical protein